MPTTTAAWICQRLSPDLSGIELGQMPLRDPGPGEALVRLRSAALNFPDLLMSQGLYQFKPPLPFVPGMEAAGVIVALGPDAGGDAGPGGSNLSANAGANAGPPGVRPLSAGDRVYVGMRNGAFAQQVVVPVASLRRLPDAFDFDEGASFRVGAITAFVALVRRGHLQAGETLLVHGASGGMGMAAVQLGKHLGATVIATGSDPARLQAVTQAGADHVLVIGEKAPGGEKGFRERVKALTGGRGADVIYDPVGGDVFDESARCIAWGGRLLVIGFTSGRIATIASNIPLIKGFSVVGVRAGETGRRDPAQGRANDLAINELANAGLLRPHIGARFAFEALPEALRALRDRRHAGKLVINS